MLRGALRRPELVLVAALAAAWLPVSVAADVRGFRDDQRRARPGEARGPAAGAGTNLTLIRAAQARIPRTADFAVVYGGRWAARRLPGGLQLARQAGASWTQYALAPRFQVARDAAGWLLLRDTTPAAQGLRPRAAWRFGSDWLVQLR